MHATDVQYSTPDEQKLAAAGVVANRVKSGEVIGLGSGSTARMAVERIGARIKAEKIEVFGVPTSLETARLAQSVGIKVLAIESAVKIEWAFDGADEVDPDLNLTKGAGGALLKEKIIARRSGKLVVMVDETKLVSALGTTSAIPIEVIPEALEYVLGELKQYGFEQAELRRVSKDSKKLFFTEHGNLIVDAIGKSLDLELENQINAITGVVENGLFIGFRPEVVIASKNGLHRRYFSDNVLIEQKLSS